MFYVQSASAVTSRQQKERKKERKMCILLQEIKKYHYHFAIIPRTLYITYENCMDIYFNIVQFIQ